MKNKNELGYALGSLGHLPTTLLSSYFLLFCTYYLNMNPAWMAGLFFAARIWDAVNDPLIGSLPDRYHFGKTHERYKPFLKLFLIPWLVCCVLSFAMVPISDGPEMVKYLWVGTIYILTGTLHTGVTMPYNALMSVITDDPAERSKLARGKSLATTLGGAALAIVAPLICFDKDSNLIPDRLFILAIVVAVFSYLVHQGMFRMCEEQISVPKPKQKYKYSRALKQVLTNRPLIGAMVIGIGVAVGTGGNTLSKYYFIEYYQNARISSLSALVAPITFLGIFFLPKMVKRFGARRLMVVTAALNFVAKLLVFLIPIPNPIVFIVIEGLMSLLIMPTGVLLGVLVANAIDYAELKTNERNDGESFAMYTMVSKFGNAFSGSFAALALELVGYQTGMNVVQSHATVMGIRAFRLGIPALGALIVAIGVCVIYNLTDEKVDEIHRELRARRKQEAAQTPEPKLTNIGTEG